MTHLLMRWAGALRPAIPVAGLSLGDCAYLAPERRLTTITAERRWPDVAKEVGVAVEVIR